MEKLVTVATFDFRAEAEVAKLFLEEQGIQAFLADDNLVGMDWFLSNAVGGVKLQVAASDVDRARDILEQIEHRRRDAGRISRRRRSRLPARSAGRALRFRRCARARGDVSRVRQLRGCAAASGDAAVGRVRSGCALVSLGLQSRASRTDASTPIHERPLSFGSRSPRFCVSRILPWLFGALIAVTADTSRTTHSFVSRHAVQDRRARCKFRCLCW